MRQKTLIFILLLLIPSLFRGQETRPVTISEDCGMSASWYKAQSDAWARLLASDKGNASAWLNYYKAERFALVAEGKEPGSPVLDSIILSMGRNIPDNSSFHYAAFWNDRENPAAFHHLEEAYRLSPGRADIYDDFIRWYEMTGNKAKKNEFVQKWNAKHPFPPELNEMSSNILAGTGAGSLILTSGYTDTYSLWLYQGSSGIIGRHVVMLEMLRDPVYRARRLKEAGFTDPYPGISSPGDRLLIEGLMAKNPAKQIHLSLNHDNGLLRTLASRLYLTGLTFRVSASPIDNLSILESNWSSFDLTELNKVCKLAGNRLSEPVMAGYLMPMTVLYQKWMEEGRKNEARELYELAEKLALATGKTKKFNTSMERRE